MATVPVMRTWVAGELVTAAYMNSNIRDLGNFTLARPMAVLRQAAAQSIPNAAWTAVLMDTEDLDRDAGHSTSSNTSRYVGKTPGWHMAVYTMTWSPNATGARWSRMRNNGTDAIATVPGRDARLSAGTVDTSMSGSGFVYLNGSTDYAELVAYQGSGGALNSYVASDSCPRLAMLWVSS